MGNKLCKKRVDTTDCNTNSGTKTPRSLNKIIHKLNLKPKWKSDSNLEDKQTTLNSEPIATIQVEAKPVSKSSDWIDCARNTIKEQQSNQDSAKKSIFNDDTTPTPPPRKCIPVRKSLLASVKEAFKATNNNEPEIEEEVMVKKTIIYNCPCGGNHARGQHDNAVKKTSRKAESSEKRCSRDVTASNNSLPNYSDTRFSLPVGDSESHASIHSLQDDNSKKANRRSISNDLDACLTRAKSIGSLIPSVLHRLSTTKAPLAEIESDDSLNSMEDGSMDDWGAGLNMIEHYQPKESSLPRPSRRTDAEIIADLEGMIVDEIIEEPPVPPARRSETLLKKIHKDVKSTNCTPPSTPEECLHLANQTYNELFAFDAQDDHSPLMKILKECKDNDDAVLIANDVNLIKSNISPVHTYKSDAANKGHIDDFLAAERAHDDLFKKQILS